MKPDLDAIVIVVKNETILNRDLAGAIQIDAVIEAVLK